MSVQLRLFNQTLRLVAKPILARTATPKQARADLARIAPFLRRPPFILHLAGTGPLPIDQISVGRVREDWAILYFHGGGYIAGSPVTHAGLMGRISRMTGLQVMAPAYRLAPEHPAPAAFEDAKLAHEALTKQGFLPDHIILAGDSAGGGLALALLADLCRRDLRPACLFAFSPWTDLALTGDSLSSNAQADPLLPVARIADIVGFVTAGANPRDPRVSPLYAEYEHPPPLLIQVGSTEVLRDDSRRMAARLRLAGGAVTLSEYPDTPHVWQMFDGYIPEARAALREVAGFLGSVISPSGRTPDES